MRNKLGLGLLALLLVFAGVGIADDHEEPKKMSGEYLWTQGGSDGPLDVIFTPTGDGEWDVAFHFTFRGKEHTYEGTASGSLSEGDLSGTVQNESKKRTFTFAGSFADGVFSGTHAETTAGREAETGTISFQ